MKFIKFFFSLDFITTVYEILCKYLPLYIYDRLTSSPKQLWLIGERKDDARDNGYFLFKYIRTSHPNVHVYYVINTQSKDYNRVKPWGNIIEWGSLQHYLYYFKASIVIGTGWGLCAPMHPMAVVIMNRILRPKGKRAFLQHGITKDKMPQAYKNKIHVDLFTCGAKPEYDFIKANFGYHADEVKYLGFARYDNLVDTSNKSKGLILYMPTWRMGIDMNKFETTYYYEAIKSFICSEELNTLLEKTDSRMVYFLHPVLKSKKSFFEECERKRVSIMNNEDCDMQILLKSCTLLITDYSSVYFDVAYLNKPIIYYQFDYEKYRKYHYPTGYFDYNRDGFGPVLTEESDLIASIKDLYINNWVNPAKYSARTKSFFILNDSNNCLRHYNALCKLEKKDNNE